MAAPPPLSVRLPSASSEAPSPAVASPSVALPRLLDALLRRAGYSSAPRSCPICLDNAPLVTLGACDHGACLPCAALYVFHSCGELAMRGGAPRAAYAALRRHAAPSAQALPGVWCAVCAGGFPGGAGALSARYWVDAAARRVAVQTEPPHDLPAGDPGGILPDREAQ